MKSKIHIMGASGSGTSTLGSSLSKVLPYRHLDTDDYFWTTKFTKQREVPERRKMLENDLSQNEDWILSGAVCGWGDNFKSYFDCVIFLWIPQRKVLQVLTMELIHILHQMLWLVKLENGPLWFM